MTAEAAMAGAKEATSIEEAISTELLLPVQTMAALGAQSLFARREL